MIDLCGMVHKHGLPEAEREYSLDGKAIRLAACICDHAPGTHENKTGRCTIEGCKCLKFERVDNPKILVCLACGAVFGAWDDHGEFRVCPECGAPAPMVKPPKVKEQELHEMGSVASDRAKSRALEQMANTCIAEGYKPGWIWHKYKARFGVAPSRGMVQQAMSFAKAMAEGDDWAPDPNAGRDAKKKDAA